MIFVDWCDVHYQTDVMHQRNDEKSITKYTHTWLVSILEGLWNIGTEDVPQYSVTETENSRKVSCSKWSRDSGGTRIRMFICVSIADHRQRCDCTPNTWLTRFHLSRWFKTMTAFMIAPDLRDDGDENLEMHSTRTVNWYRVHTQMIATVQRQIEHLHAKHVTPNHSINQRSLVTHRIQPA